MSISKEFVVNLRGRDYAVYAGVLSAAHEAGLRSLTTEIVQIPSPENGHMAVVMARAEFEDGRVFEDVGDCSPANTSPQIASAALRMASTRAKGRVLRDAVNVGQTLLEELPDMEEEIARHDMPPRGGNGRSHYPTEPARSSGAPRSVVAERPAPPPSSRAAAGSAPRAAPPTAAVAEPGTPDAKRATPEASEPMVCSTATCGKALTKGQYEVSLRAYGHPLCPACQKAAAAKA